MDPAFKLDFSTGSLITLPFPHPLNRQVLPIFLLYSEGGQVVRAEPLATCFAIGHGLLLTARHVIDDLFPHAIDGKVDASEVAPLVLVTPEGGRAEDTVRVPIIGVSTNDASDLALLSIPTSDEVPRMAATPLTVCRPQIGDEVMAFGYANIDATAEAPDRVVVEPVLHVAKGTVTADRIRVRYPERTSPPLEGDPPTPRYLERAFPALEADFPFPPGMSGGPVIVAAPEGGELLAPGTGICAVCSSSIKPFYDNDSWTSWAALVAPAFALEVETNLDGEIATRTVHELAQKQVVVTDGTHDQVFVTDDDPRTVGWVDRDAERAP